MRHILVGFSDIYLDVPDDLLEPDGELVGDVEPNLEAYERNINKLEALARQEITKNLNRLQVDYAEEVASSGR